jgi:hypothetical protein
MKIYKSLYSLIAFSMLQSHIANAKSAYIESPLRPRIEQVLPEHPKYKPEEGIPVYGGRLNFANFRNSLFSGAAQFIAKIESAYPGATYAFMGRDTQLIADIVDAFYLSIGQKGRVVQIAMSSPTLASSSEQDVIDYMKYFGFDIDNVDKAKPFILVDTISKGEVQDDVLISGRQGRRLLQSIYAAWVAHGEDPAKLLPAFNMIGMQVSTFDTESKDNKKRYKDIEKMSSVIKSNKKKFEKNGMNGEFGRTMVLPLIPDTPSIFNESGYDHFTAAWHGKYQAPIRMEDGTLAPNPGPLNDKTHRQSVLWMQHQVIDIVNDPNFRTNVINEFKTAGVKIPVRVDGFLISCRNVMLKK